MISGKAARQINTEKPPLQVFIVFGNLPEGCTAECGIDWSSPEAVALAQERVKARFGDSVNVNLVNINDKEFQSWEFERLVKDRNITLPALIINGQPRISGLFDIRLLLDAIEVNLEMAVG